MGMTFWTDRRAVAALLLLGAAGCGPGLYPVSGKVTFADEAPLTSGMVVFERVDGDEKDNALARGPIQSDGNYQLSTANPGDGVPPGKYRVLIAPPPLVVDPENGKPSIILPPPFDRRFMEFSTSGLEYEVRSGRNEFNIRVTKPEKSPR